MESDIGDASSREEPVRSPTVGEVAEAAKEALQRTSVDSVGAAALYSGLAAVSVVFTSQLLDNLDAVPLAPELMQTVGVLYCCAAAWQYYNSIHLPLAPLPSVNLPFPRRLSSANDPVPFTQVDGKDLTSEQPLRERLRVLAGERDVAVAQVEAFRRAGYEAGRVAAEKEALEAVAMQLAEERDSAVAEVTALKTAVNAMTERMRAIEAMLAQEVQRLQEQNSALETVALQLADERDAAMNKANEVRVSFEAQRAEDKRVLETLAEQLIEERNAAVKEVQELKQVVAGLVQTSSSASGLTHEMEAFIQSRARAMRSQFVDVSRPYTEQRVAVDKFISHLVNEYGAPRDWTTRYIRQILDGLAEGDTSVFPSSHIQKHEETHTPL